MSMYFQVEYNVDNRQEKIINYIYSVLVDEIKERNECAKENGGYIIPYKENLNNCIVLFLQEFNQWYTNNKKLYKHINVLELYTNFLQTCIFHFEINSYNMIEVFFKDVLQFREDKINELYKKSNTFIEQYYYMYVCLCLERLARVYSNSVLYYDEKVF